MIAKFDPNLPITDNWKMADPLNSAWFLYAPPHYADQYRDSGRNEAKSLTLRCIMEKEVAELLGDGEFIALGIESHSSAKLIPEIIPATMFVSSAVRIDWEKSEIEGFGRLFGDVRICKPAVGTPDVTKSAVETVTKRGGGRSDIYPFARIVLTELYSENPAYLRFSAEKLEPAFNERYLKLRSTKDLKVAPVSQRSLRNYLKQYRQELAETGNN